MHVTAYAGIDVIFDEFSLIHMMVFKCQFSTVNLIDQPGKMFTSLLELSREKRAYNSAICSFVVGGCVSN